MSFMSKFWKTTAGLAIAFGLSGFFMTVRDVEKGIISRDSNASTRFFAWGRNTGTAILWTLGQAGQFCKGVYDALSEDASEVPPSSRKSSSALPKASGEASLALAASTKPMLPGLSSVFTVESEPNARVSGPLLSSGASNILKNNAAPEPRQSLDIS